jgi:hypothetical protein
MPAGLGKRSRLSNHLKIGLPAKQSRHEVSEVGLVLDQHDTGPR